MNTLFVVIIGAVVIWAAYNLYARRIDKNVIQVSASKATPAKMYMDGVDFTPASRNVLFGYQFKSIAAAGPIVGAITAATFWGWLPALLWLLLLLFFASGVFYVRMRIRGMLARRQGISPGWRTAFWSCLAYHLVLLVGLPVLAARTEYMPHESKDG